MASRFALLCLVARSMVPPPVDDTPAAASITFQKEQSSEIPSDWLQAEALCPDGTSYDLMDDHFSRYTSIPLALLTHERSHSCHNLENKKGIVKFESLNGLSPPWLVDATLAGECPWQLVKRRFRDSVPPSVVEMNCVCDGQRCTRGGDFRCTPVIQNVTIWTGIPSMRRPRNVSVTVACACAQRYSPPGGNVPVGLIN